MHLKQGLVSKAVLCSRIAQVYRSRMYGELYASDRSFATQKPHALWSNDKSLLERLFAVGGTCTQSDREQLTGAPLTKKYKRPDGTTGFCGNGDTLKQSQPWPQAHGLRCMVSFTNLRTYHPLFGAHLAQLMRAMGGADWEALCQQDVCVSCLMLNKNIYIYIYIHVWLVPDCVRPGTP